MTNQDQPKGQAELTDAQRILFEVIAEHRKSKGHEEITDEIVIWEFVNDPKWNNVWIAMERYAALKSNHVEEQPRTNEQIFADKEYYNKWLDALTDSEKDLVIQMMQEAREYGASPKSEERETGWSKTLPTKQGHYFVRVQHSFPKNCDVVIAEFYDDNNMFYSESGDSPIEDAIEWMRVTDKD